MKGMLKQLRVPGKESHKGENGKLLVVAGSGEYHGAPALCVLGARRFCDLVYFIPGEDAPGALQSIHSIPEAIIPDSLPDADCVLYGPGLGNAKFPFQALRKYGKKVIDGDGLKKIQKSWLKGTIITPHEGEFRMLFGVPGTPQSVKECAKKYSCTILKKGRVDLISDGTRLMLNKTGNAGMTKGGTGDVLSGLTAAFFCKNPPLVAAACAAYINGLAGRILYSRNSYAYCASDLADALPEAYKKAIGKR